MIEERFDGVLEVAVDHVKVVHRLALVEALEELAHKLMHVMASFHKEYLTQNFEMFGELALGLKSLDELGASGSVNVFQRLCQSLLDKVLNGHAPKPYERRILLPTCCYQLIHYFLSTYVQNRRLVVLNLLPSVAIVIGYLLADLLLKQGIWTLLLIFVIFSFFFSYAQHGLIEKRLSLLRGLAVCRPTQIDNFSDLRQVKEANGLLIARGGRYVPAKRRHG